MKKKLLGPTAGKVLLAIGCLLLAIVFWFIIKYAEAKPMPIDLFGFS